MSLCTWSSWGRYLHTRLLFLTCHSACIFHVLQNPPRSGYWACSPSPRRYPMCAGKLSCLPPANTQSPPWKVGTCTFRREMKFPTEVLVSEDNQFLRPFVSTSPTRSSPFTPAWCPGARSIPLAVISSIYLFLTSQSKWTQLLGKVLRAKTFFSLWNGWCVKINCVKVLTFKLSIFPST